MFGPFDSQINYFHDYSKDYYVRDYENIKMFSEETSTIEFENSIYIQLHKKGILLLANKEYILCNY